MVLNSNFHYLRSFNFLSILKRCLQLKINIFLERKQQSKTKQKPKNTSVSLSLKKKKKSVKKTEH